MAGAEAQADRKGGGRAGRRGPAGWPWRPRPPHRTQAQGDGTPAALGSETPWRRPGAAGSGCWGEAGKKEEVVVIPGPVGTGTPGAGPLPEQETDEEEEEGQRTRARGWEWWRPSCLVHMAPWASLRTHPSHRPCGFLFPREPLGNILGW